jgi:predicted Zn-dependent protease
MATLRPTTAAAVLLAIAGAMVLPSAVAAQRPTRSGPPADAPRFMVNTFRSPDAKTGVDAAEELRERLQQMWSRTVLVIPKASIDANLEASGFDPNAPVDAVTARLLAQQLRAEEYLEGTITRDGSGYRVESRLMLTRDRDLAQPLPVATGSIRDAVNQIARSLNDARKQLDEEKRCNNSLRGNNAQQAISHARAAIQEYPQSTVGRLCLARAMIALKAPNDSIIAVTAKVVEIDPKNKPALELLGQAYKTAGNMDKAVEVWTELLALDPQNVRLQQQYAEELARSGKANLAKPIIARALSANPGDPGLMRLNFLILLANRDWKDATAAGEELARIDTSASDTAFFDRLAKAYASDSQPQKAAEVTARAVAKFPNNATLWSLHSQLLRSAGQTQQAVDAARRAVSINAKVEHGYLRLAQAQIDLGATDSALISLRQAVQNGEDASLVGQILLVQGNQLYRSATQSKNRADFQKAVEVLTLSDSLAPSPSGAFLLGVSAFNVADIALRENERAKNCDNARLAEQMLAVAQINIPKGAQVDRNAAGQLMSAMQQYNPAVEAQVRRYCR